MLKELFYLEALKAYMELIRNRLIQIYLIEYTCFGLCYGHQLIAHLVRGDVQLSPKKEFGDTTIVIDKPIGILKGLGDSVKVWMSHSDTVNSVPSDYEVIAHSDNTPVAAFKHKTKPIFGLQWHPEVIHTEQGALVLKNFVIDVCKAEPEWKMKDFVQASIKEIKDVVGDGRCIVALSGGVDSSVAAALVGRAIDGNLTAIYVDTGLMREGETDEIKRVFKEIGVNLITLNKQEKDSLMHSKELEIQSARGR